MATVSLKTQYRDSWGGRRVWWHFKKLHQWDSATVCCHKFYKRANEAVVCLFTFQNFAYSILCSFTVHSKAFQDVSLVDRLPVPGWDFWFILSLRFVLFRFVPLHDNLTLEFCHLPIKKMMWLSLFLSYTASILFVSAGRPIQKFWIQAGLLDTKDPSLLVLQNCAPLSKKGMQVCYQCRFGTCNQSQP